MLHLKDNPSRKDIALSLTVVFPGSNTLMAFTVRKNQNDNCQVHATTQLVTGFEYSRQKSATIMTPCMFICGHRSTVGLFLRSEIFRNISRCAKSRATLHVFKKYPLISSNYALKLICIRISISR